MSECSIFEKKKKHFNNNIITMSHNVGRENFKLHFKTFYKYVENFL